MISREEFLAKLSLRTFLRNNVAILTKKKDDCFYLAYRLLQELSNHQTAIFLSGGATPKKLYEKIAQGPYDSADFAAGAVALIDERYTTVFENTNEYLLQKTKLITYLSTKNISFYNILKNKDIDETVRDYDETVRYILHNFRKSVAIMGIGKDGHIAGIAPKRIDFENPLFKKEDRNAYVSSFNDEKGPFQKRVTMTFLSLSFIDFFIVLAVGKEKREAMTKLFETGSEEEIPARFYIRKDIASKTLLITDQKV